MHKCAYMSTLCTRTLVACPLRSTGITPGFSVCSCPSCEALGYRGDPQCSQCGGRGCSSARGDHESSASALPCECQRHRRERKCLALCTRCFCTRQLSENWPALLFR